MTAAPAIESPARKRGRPRKPRPEVPIDAQPLSEDELETKLAKFPPAEQLNLRITYHKYLQGETQKWQEEKLMAKGIIGGKIKTKELPLQCSLGQLADYLTETYGKELGQTYYVPEIKAWTKEGMPGPAGPGGNHRINSGPAIKWILENKILMQTGGATGGGDNLPKRAAEAKANQEIIAERRALRADIEEQRKFDARWMLRECHDYEREGFGMIVRQEILSLLKGVLDDVRQSDKEAGIDDAAVERQIAALRPKIDAKFEASQQALATKAEEIDRAAHEMSEQKKAELKVKNL